MLIVARAAAGEFLQVVQCGGGVVAGAAYWAAAGRPGLKHAVCHALIVDP